MTLVYSLLEQDRDDDLKDIIFDCPFCETPIPWPAERVLAMRCPSCTLWVEFSWMWDEPEIIRHPLLC